MSATLARAKHFTVSGTAQRGRTQQGVNPDAKSYAEHRAYQPTIATRKVARVDPHNIGKHFSPDRNPAKGPLDTTRNPTLPSFEGQLHFSMVPDKVESTRARPPIGFPLAPKKEYETQNDY